MQEQTFSLKQQINYHHNKHKNAYNKVQTVVNRMLDLYEQAQKNIENGKNHQNVITDLNQQLLNLRPLKNIREHYVHYYRKLSNLTRRLQYGNKNNNTGFSRHSKRRDSNNLNKEQKNLQKFKKYINSFITEQKQRKALLNMIIEHFLRQGQFQCAKVWEEEFSETDQNNLFHECYKIKYKIKKGHFEDAILWCQNQRLFQTKECLLQYELLKTDIVALVDKGRSQQALTYFIKKMPKYSSSKQEQIQQLMGFILFRSKHYWAEQLDKMNELSSFCDQRYKQFVFNDKKCQQLSDTFVKEYLRHNNISQFDVLKIVYTCSQKIQEQYQRLMTLTWQNEIKSLQQKMYEKQLPFSIELDNCNKYHSLFLCPVTKEVQTSGDSTVLLSCGHMISKTAQDRIIQQNRNRRRVKCPICQNDIRPDDSVFVEY